MAKAGELKWDELFKSKKEDAPHLPSALWTNSPNIGAAPKGEAKPRLQKGEIPDRPSNEEISKAILSGAKEKGAQPTDEQMFGHLVPTEEQVKKAKEEWENRINKSLTMPNIGAPLDDEEWGTGKSFNSTLSRAEILKRNMHLDD